MGKRALRKDIRQSFARSWPRFASIVCLIALGTFGLVGLKVTGPDMRATERTFAQSQDVADLAVIADYGLSEDDRAAIDATPGIRAVEYGYLKDVVIRGTDTSIRIFSEPQKLSRYQVVRGRMPRAPGEVALDAGRSGRYAIGDTIHVTEKPDAAGVRVLRRTSFTVVGFVNSGEIISTLNRGESTDGTGALDGYAVVEPGDFHSDVHMVARLAFDDTRGVDPFSDRYADLLQAHKDALGRQLADQPAKRLADLKREYQGRIDRGRAQVRASRAKLASAKRQLDRASHRIEDAKGKIADGRRELDRRLADGRAQAAQGEDRLRDATGQVEAAERQLDAAGRRLASGRQTLDAQWGRLQSAKEQLDAAHRKLADTKSALDSASDALESGRDAITRGHAQLAEAQKRIDDAQKQIDAKRQQLEDGKTQYEHAITDLTQTIDGIDKELLNPDLSPERRAQLEQQKATCQQLAVLQKQYHDFLDTTYTPGMAELAAAQREVSDAAAQVDAGRARLAAQKRALDARQSDYHAGLRRYEQGRSTYATNLDSYYAGLERWRAAAQKLRRGTAEYQRGAARIRSANAQLADKRAELADAKRQIAAQQSAGERRLADASHQLSDQQRRYRARLRQYEESRPAALRRIADAEQRLADAQVILDGLRPPVYSADSRREVPGSEGYRVYTTVSQTVDSLADIFPIFLYFVAALVTFNTMMRFVDEERINSGTLKALGYGDADVMAKFLLYGLLAGLLGAAIGTALGHTLLPWIVYSAYRDGFSLPRIELHFQPGVTVVAASLALASAVLPAYIAAARELRERPAALLLPKPPAKGSSILVERIPAIWNRLRFTDKVTARGVFRNKVRASMTIFGVAGSVCMLFAGLAVQHSISGINQRQFGSLVHYDLIVADNATLTDAQNDQIDRALASSAIEDHMDVHYEQMSVNAGRSNDRQEVRLVVPADARELARYVSLTDRASGRAEPLDANGVVISERLAGLLHARRGSTIRLRDAEGQMRSMRVTAVSELYMGHLAVMSRSAYQGTFHQRYAANAKLVGLKDRSLGNVERQAAAFMRLGGVQGVVQNAQLRSQVDTVVRALDMIMRVLIAVSAMLTVVILFNLTNITISERVRELSTIKVLGFFDREVTMYAYRETIILSSVGVLVGYAFGEALHRYVITAVPPDDVMFNPALAPPAFLLPLAVVAAVTAGLGGVVHRRLKRLDMLAALKSVE